MPQETKKISKQLDKTTLAIVLYFIEELNGVLGKTHLQKLLFLSDLIAVKKFKKQFTKLEYEKYKFGPYSNAVNAYVNYLKGKDLIEIRKFSFLSDKSKTYIRYYRNKKSSIKNFLQQKLGADRLLALNDIISSYGNMSLQDVLDIVYELELVKKSKPCTPLNIAKDIQDDNNEESEHEFNPFT